MGFIEGVIKSFIFGGIGMFIGGPIGLIIGYLIAVGDHLAIVMEEVIIDIHLIVHIVMQRMELIHMGDIIVTVARRQ